MGRRVVSAGRVAGPVTSRPLAAVRGGNLTKTGNGTLVLDGSSSSLYGNTVSTGVLRITNGDKLGGRPTAWIVHVAVHGDQHGNCPLAQSLQRLRHDRGTLTVDGQFTMDDGAVYDWQIGTVDDLLVNDKIVVIGSGTGNTWLGQGLTLRLHNLGLPDGAIIMSSDKFDLITYTDQLGYKYG